MLEKIPEHFDFVSGDLIPAGYLLPKALVFILETGEVVLFSFIFDFMFARAL